MDSDLIPV